MFACFIFFIFIKEIYVNRNSSECYFYVMKIRIRFGVFSLGENVRLIKDHKFIIILIIEFGGHSDGVTPGLVSIPEVKSFRVLFVYYGFRSMGISFSCQPFFIQE